MSTVAKEWKRLERALGKDAKRLSLRPGTTVKKIEAAEKKLGFPLPEQLRSWLEIHDGQKSGDDVLSVLATGGPLLPLADIVDTWKLQCESGDPDEAEEKPQDKGRIRWLLSHPRRVPIGGDFEMGGGTFIDQIPAPKGTMDQVISLVSECDFWVLSKSFAEMIAKTADLVEKKSLRTVDDPLRLELAKGESGFGGWAPLLRKQCRVELAEPLTRKACASAPELRGAASSSGGSRRGMDAARLARRMPPSPHDTEEKRVLP